MNTSSKSNLFALSTILLWSTSATAFKLTLSGMSNLQLLFYSSLVSTIILGVFYYHKTHTTIKSFFEKRKIFAGIKLGIANPFLYYLILFKAYSLLPAQEALALNFTWPIAISILSRLFLKQHLQHKVILGMMIAFLGVVVISTRGNLLSFSFESPLGIGLALISSVFWASFWIMNLLDKRDTYEKLFSAFFYSTIITGFYLYFSEGFIIQNSFSLIGAIYVGMFEMGFGFIFWLKALELSDNKSRTSTMAYLSPFLSLIVIAIVLGESLMISSIAGLILIIGGISLQHIKFKGFSRVK